MVIPDTVKILIAAAGGGYVTYFLEKRKQRFSKNLDEKREVYNEFVSLIVDLLNSSRSSNTSDVEKSAASKETIDKFYEFYKKFILFASSKSIDAFGEWMTYIRSSNVDNKVWIGMLSNLIGSMRKDLGLSNFWLGANKTRLLRALLTDYDSIFEKKSSSGR
jgi:hypothetical protein